MAQQYHDPAATTRVVVTRVDLSFAAILALVAKCALASVLVWTALYLGYLVARVVLRFLVAP